MRDGHFVTYSKIFRYWLIVGTTSNLSKSVSILDDCELKTITILSQIPEKHTQTDSVRTST